MRPSIEPDGKAPSGSLDRRKARRHEAVRLRFSTPPKRLSAALHVENRRLTAGTGAGSGRLLPSRWTGKTPSSPTGAAKGADCRKDIFCFPGRGRRQTPDFQHRPEKALAFPLRSMLKVRRLPPGAKVSRVRPQNSGPSTFAALMTASPWGALRSVASRGNAGKILDPGTAAPDKA